VWEVIAAVRSARAAEPELSPDKIVGVVAETAGLGLELVHAALSYRADYPAEVDAVVEQARTEAEQAQLRWQRQHDLLDR
jgi:hypothetical protein